jgi:hypothetical protein
VWSAVGATLVAEVGMLVAAAVAAEEVVDCGMSSSLGVVVSPTAQSSSSLSQAVSALGVMSQARARGLAEGVVAGEGASWCVWCEG